MLTSRERPVGIVASYIYTICRVRRTLCPMPSQRQPRDWKPKTGLTALVGSRGVRFPFVVVTVDGGGGGQRFGRYYSAVHTETDTSAPPRGQFCSRVKKAKRLLRVSRFCFCVTPVLFYFSTAGCCCCRVGDTRRTKKHAPNYLASKPHAHHIPALTPATASPCWVRLTACSLISRRPPNLS